MLSLFSVAGTGLVLAFVWFRFWRADAAPVGTSFRTGRLKHDKADVDGDGLGGDHKTKMPAFGRRSTRTVARS